MVNNKENQGFHVIIAAAGQGSRLGSALPKQYVKINGRSILRHTVENILRWPGVLSVHIIIDPEHADLYQEAVTGLPLPPPLAGGKTRKQSIYNALKDLSQVKNDEILLVHDAARPLTAWHDTQKLLDIMTPGHAASLARPVTDTLRCEDETINRNGVWALQTPQAFYFGDLKSAHENAAAEQNFTDDTGLVAAAGIPVKLVEGSATNIKITTQDDLLMAQALLSLNSETRTGMGFDVHAFDKSGSGKPLKLCGVTVPHDYPLAGHSDADVGLHALTDALLGTICAGDIGTHFPPTDQKYKNMDSGIFLSKAVELIKAKGGTILHMDLTLICETPKIGPHTVAMKSRIAEITNIDAARVSIKATTTEKLGFTGRGEGIAAQAVATVKLPCS